jgi:hypothetical protein
MSDWLADAAQTLGTILTLASCTALSRSAKIDASPRGGPRCAGTHGGQDRVRHSRDLNQDAVPTAQGARAWSQATVRALLMREGVH